VVLERYRLIRRLGAGAFGTVWMAHDEHLERDVAVKILPPERVQGGRFAREARAAARLAHPGIVTLYEAAVDQDGAYLVSQLVLGDTLDALLTAGDLSDRDVIAVGIALCDALAHAHGHGIVHRDVKPSNVLVPEAPTSAGEVAKLTDFGVARLIDADQLTLTGDVIGTLAYMAPEQAGGQAVGPAADVYSLALVLYEALTGVNPSADRLRDAGPGSSRRLPPLRHQRRDLPRDLSDALDLTLCVSPEARAGLDELRAALVHSRPEVSDRPGVIEAPWSPLTRVTQRAPRFLDPLDPADPLDPGRRRGHLRPGDEGDGPDAQRERPAGSRPAWPERAVGALGSAVIALWLAGRLGLAAPAAPIGLVAAGLSLLLPRLSWLLLGAAAGVAGLLTGHTGLAGLVPAALLLAPALLLRAPGLWGAAAGAPGLGLVGPIGLAGAWPAVAGQAATFWRRAGLGAVGWIWLVLVGGLTRHVVLLTRLPGARAPAAVINSPSAAVTGLVEPALRSGALVPALVWALGAGTLPWIVGRGDWRSRGVRAVAWAAAVAVGPGLILGALGPGHAPAPPGLPIGLVGGLIVVWAASGEMIARWRASRGSQELVVP
jgi:serine/threonine protein kinase